MKYVTVEEGEIFRIDSSTRNAYSFVIPRTCLSGITDRPSLSHCVIKLSRPYHCYRNDFLVSPLRGIKDTQLDSISLLFLWLPRFQIVIHRPFTNTQVRKQVHPLGHPILLIYNTDDEKITVPSNGPRLRAAPPTLLVCNYVNRTL